MPIRSFSVSVTIVALWVLLCAQVGNAAPSKEASPSNSANSAAPAAEPQGNPKSIEFNERGVAAVGGRDTRAAEDLFRKAVEADSKNISAVFNLSGMLLTNQKEAQAISLLESYTRDFATDAGLWARLGDAYFSTKKTTEAQRAYERAWKIDPSTPTVSAKLATIYTLSNQLSKAEKTLLDAVDQSPRDVQLLSNLSAVFLANNKADMAVSTAKRGIQLKPTRELYITLGTAYETKKDYKNSLIAFQRAKDLGDTRAELQQKIDALSKIQG